MKTQFNKGLILTSLDRLDKAIKVGSEDQEREIAEDYHYLREFIEEVFEFDFFQLRKDIEFIIDELIRLRK